jgi:hypothetical protein
MPFPGQQLYVQKLIDRETRKVGKRGTENGSPICVNEVEKLLENYPYKDIACELIKGFKFGFPLNYSGPRSPSDLLASLAIP